MAKIHFLNVKEGDCNIIEHKGSGRVTVIDVSNARKDSTSEDISVNELCESIVEKTAGVSGNFHQKKYPVNPVSYMKEVIKNNSVFRFILTHPDMDHMDGIKDFFEEFSISNFWDISHNKEKPNFASTGKYREEDWDYYESLREKEFAKNFLAGNEFKYFADDPDNNKPQGDGLYILSPTKELVDLGNASKEYNDMSYVLLLKAHGRKIVFGGDSHDQSWENILKGKYAEEIRNIDLLIAPHHGRDSDRNYDFLDHLNPKLTFFGNARSQHLAYSAWNNRDLKFITNNQANTIVANVDSSDSSILIYAGHEKYARAVNRFTFYSEINQGWFVTSL